MTDNEMVLADFPKWSEHFEWRYVLSNYRPCRVLDFGCGYGYSDIYLGMNGFTVDGYDSDPERIDAARHLLSFQSTEVRRRVQFLTEIPVGEYDLVWMSHVAEHIPVSEWKEMFGKIVGNSRSILVSVPLGHAYEHFQHVNHWNTAGDLLHDLVDATGLMWKVWEDLEHHVIKAVTIEDSRSNNSV